MSPFTVRASRATILRASTLILVNTPKLMEAFARSASPAADGAFADSLNASITFTQSSDSISASLYFASRPM